MAQVRRSAWGRYGVAVLASVCSLLLRRAIMPLVGDDNPYVILLTAPMVAAWFGGFGPGIVAVILSALAADYFFIHPLRTLFGNGVVHDGGLVLFVLEGTFVSWLTDSLHRARLRAEESEARLTESDVRKDEFLATLGHELRNPLATVRHATAILKDPRAREPQLVRARETIERQSDYMTRLIDDILDVSRITRGVLTFEMQRIDLRDAVAQAVEQCRTHIDGRRHEFAMSLPGEPVWIEGDSVRLTQVVSNLLVNAAKYTDEGGKIALAVAPAGTDATITVRDNGMGILPDLMPNVFQLFTQSERARTRSQGGLGLGLAVVRSIVERHGGSVVAASGGAGRGSEFTVHLPMKELHPASGPKSKSPKKRGILRRKPSPVKRRAAAPLRIVVIDDNTDMAQSLATILKLEGHDVRIATTGRMGLEVARSHRPEVMLVDLRLPDCDGCEVVQKIAQSHRDQAPVLIALTGFWGEDVRQRCLEAGFHAFLLKPISSTELQQTIDECLAPPTPRPVARLSDPSIAMRELGRDI